MLRESGCKAAGPPPSSQQLAVELPRNRVSLETLKPTLWRNMFHSANERLTCVARASARSVNLTWDGTKDSLTDSNDNSVFVGFVLHRTDPQLQSTWLHSQAKQLADGDQTNSPAPPESQPTEPCQPVSQLPADIANPPAAVLNSPLQDFMWADYTVAPATTYTYTLLRVTRQAGEATATPEVSLCVTTPSEAILGAGVDHVLFFNRGVAGSQGYNRRFGQGAKPGDRRPAGADDPWAWLSRGLEEGLLDFLQCAEGPGWAVRGACYEFSYAPVLHALAAVRERQVDIKVVYDAKRPSWSAAKRHWTPNGPLAESDAAIAAVGISEIMIPRRAGKSAIQHNKFFVLLHDQAPVAVWTGSTNLTTSGIFGQVNVRSMCGACAVYLTALALNDCASSRVHAQNAHHAQRMHIMLQPLCSLLPECRLAVQCWPRMPRQTHRGAVCWLLGDARTGPSDEGLPTVQQPTQSPPSHRAAAGWCHNSSIQSTS